MQQRTVICPNLCHNPCFSRNVFAINFSRSTSKVEPASQSLFQQKCLCNYGVILSQSLFQQKCLCNHTRAKSRAISDLVTILVLVEMSLQSNKNLRRRKFKNSHNPCFSRNVFAICNLCIWRLRLFVSQSLFQQKCLCNRNRKLEYKFGKTVTILVLVEMSLQS